MNRHKTYDRKKNALWKNMYKIQGKSRIKRLLDVINTVLYNMGYIWTLLVIHPL